MRLSKQTLVLIVALGGSALAEPPALPPAFKVPPGCHLDAKLRYAAFGREELEPALPAPHQVVLEGPVWMGAVVCDDKPPVLPAVVADRFTELLGPLGWERLSKPPYGLFRLTKDGGERWLRLQTTDSHWFSFTLIEKGAPARRLEIPAPSETVEEIAPKATPPWMPPFPGATVRDVSSHDNPFEVTEPKDKERRWVGHPTLMWSTDGPADLGAHEFKTVYKAALERAGWKVAREGGGGGSSGDYVLLAHYAEHGRDIWLYVHAGDGNARFNVADVGAEAAATKLRSALDHDGHVALYGIYFDTDQAVLKPESEATLRQILELLRADPKLALRVEGHTDDAGSHEHNQPLSEHRAAAVKGWLEGHGVAAARLTAAGFAETRPVADNKTPEGRAKNRRVELARP